MIAAAVRNPLASALVRIPATALSVVAVAVVALATASFDGLYAVAPALLLGAGFLLIVSGTFGLLLTRLARQLLLTRLARRLGDISYGIYLPAEARSGSSL
jgi:peptidoglycan/LPS O-acetylase OafA/YrhL